MASNRAFGTFIRSNILIRGATHNSYISLFSTAAPEAQVENATTAVKPFEEIPGPKGLYQWPVIGTMLHFKPFTDFGPEKSHKVIDQMFEKYGPIFRWRFGPQAVVVCDPKDLETIFRNEGKYPVRPVTLIGKKYTRKNNFPDNLTDLDGEEWHTLRTPLNKRLMRVDSAQYYLEPQNLVADDFVDILAHNEKSPEDLAELFFCYAAESIGVVCFNTRLGFLNNDAMQNPETLAFLKASKDVFVYLHKSFYQKTIDWYHSSVYKGYENARLLLRENTVKHIEKAKEVLQSRKEKGTLDPEEPNLLLSLLSDNSVESLDIVGTIKMLYVAGTDSTAKNLQTLFYNLATNPDKQEQLRQEIINVIGHDQPVTAKSLSKMPYLKASLKESFRLHYPTVSGTNRILATDVVLSGYRVPAGTLLSLHNPRTCREYFSNSDKFIPERWLRSSGGTHTEEIPATASLPFGYGPRNCVGRRFAEQEIYLAVAKVLQKLKIEVEPESSIINFIYTLFIQPEKPIKFKFTKIDG